MKNPSKYTFQLAPKTFEPSGARVLAEILDGLIFWQYTDQPIPIFVRLCPKAYRAVKAESFTGVRNWILSSLRLNPLTPIIFEEYRCP